MPIDVSNPAEQVFLILFGTGIRGRAAHSSVTALIGSVEVHPEFAGAQGALTGVDQINLRLPAALTGRGAVNIALSVDSQASNVVQVIIK